MKLLMLDYLRRKSWMLLLGAVLEFVVGMFSALHYDNGSHPLAPLQVQLGIFLGPFLLSFDLQRGLARAVSVLPLTARQIARAWWFATVAIPTAIFTALMFAGAAVMCLIRPHVVVDWNWMAMAGLILFLWMGSTFTMIFLVGYGFGSGWRRVLNVIAGTFWGLMIGCSMWLLGLVWDKPVRMDCMLALGALLTMVGWFRSEQLVRGRAAFRLAAQTGGRRRGVPQLQTGYGGIPLLISATFSRAFLLGVGTMLVMALVFFMQGGLHYDWRGAVKSLLGMGFFPFWFITFVALAPAFMQLRLLRSLPISTTSLSAIMLAIVLLPLLALGVLMAGVMGAAMGAQTALSFVTTFLLTFPMAALCVVFFAWLGNGTTAFLSMLFLITAVQIVSIIFGAYQKIPLAGAAAIVGVFVLLCFWLVRRLLLRGSKPYRIQPNLFGNPAWWQAR